MEIFIKQYFGQGPIYFCFLSCSLSTYYFSHNRTDYLIVRNSGNEWCLLRLSRSQSMMSVPAMMSGPVMMSRLVRTMAADGWGTTPLPELYYCTFARQNPSMFLWLCPPLPFSLSLDLSGVWYFRVLPFHSATFFHHTMVWHPVAHHNLL